jgi:hypothetical protein
MYFVTTKTLKYWIALITVSSTVSATLACSVYTVQPPDHRHAHSLLHLCSKVVCVLPSFIPCTSTSRVPESYQSYPTSPPMTPDTHSTVPYSPTLTSPPTICSDKSLPPLFTIACPAPLEAEFNRALHSNKDLLPIASVFPLLTAISPSTCKGTSVHFLTSSLLSYSPPVHMYFPTHLCTISRDHTQSRRLLYSKSDDFPDVNFLLLPPLVPQRHRTCLGRIRTGPRDTTAPSAITWTAIYGRLGTGRLGIVILSISVVV